MKRRNKIKVSSRRDHPVFLGFLLIGIILFSQQPIQDSLRQKDDLTALIFAVVLVLGLSTQIHQEILIAKGKFTFKFRGSETKFDINKVDVTCISRWLIVRQGDISTQIDLKNFSKGQRRKVLEHLGKEEASKRQTKAKW